MADGSDSSNQGGATPPPSHQVEGHFELLQEIGSGSSGTVYRARLTQDYGEHPAGTEVAVKFLRPELADDERARARLFAEGEVGRSVHHRNVAQIYGVETISLLGLETTYLVMQYVQGTTLRELLQRSGVPVEDLTRRLGADAAKGLHALHRKGLVHRDVKPENLILTPDSELKIVDLGLARPFGAVGSGSGSGSSPGRSSGVGLGGTIAYASPETLRGQPTGPHSDLYALGIVLFEVTTGQHPFADATSPDEMLHAHLYRLPPLPTHLRPRVSPLLEQVLLDLLQKDPADRPRSAGDVARILEQGEHSDYWKKHEANAPVLASSRRLGRMRRPAEAPFVGRRSEAARLDDAFAAARKRQGQVLAVCGPEGMGRRRLLDEVMERWLDSSAPPRYLGGEADSGLGHGEPFASTLLDLLLRGDDRHSPNARPRAVERARARFDLSERDAEALAAVAFGDSTEPSEVRADRLARALLQLSQEDRPLVVRIDRADELDTSGRQVLQRLAAAAPTRRLLVLLAVGPDSDLVDEQHRIELPGLGERAFVALGRSLFRDGGAAEGDRDGNAVDAFLRELRPIVGGMPGSLLEALDHLVHEGELRGAVGDYHSLRPDVEPRPAPGLLERFRARVRTLDDSQRQVLAAAAVLGDRCSLADLAVLVGDSELAVLETLSLFRGRIVRAQAGEVSFRHRDFRRALLRSLPNEEQQRLHHAAAELFAARDARPLVVGMHRSQALDHQGALEPLLAGLRNRVDAGSRRTALRLVGRLAVHLRHVDDTDANRRRRLRFLLLAGEAHQNADQQDQASRMFRQAERLARELDDLDASAEARIGLANNDLDAGRMLSALALLETVHDDLAPFAHVAVGGDADEPGGSERRDALATRAHALHGRILLYLGQAADSLKHLQAAKKRAPVDAHDLRCHLWIDLARTEALSQRYATALRTLREIEKAPVVQNQPRARLRFHLYRGQVRMLIGDPQASQDLRVALDDAERLNLPVYGARAAVFLGERQFLRGRDDEAEQRFEQAVALARAARDTLGEAMARSHLVRLGHDDPELLALVQKLDLPSLHGNWLLAMAGSGRAVDDTDEQLEQLLANTDLPLTLHLRALLWLQRPASARTLVRSISERFAQRSLRQQFLRQWNRGVRA